MKLSKDQNEALTAFEYFIIDPTQHEFIMSGPAGTGKTFMIKQFLEAITRSNKIQLAINDKFKKPRIHCTSTTNVAAAVLREYTSMSTTIHSLLQLVVKNNYSTGKTYLAKRNPKLRFGKRDIIIIDEAPKIDKQLFNLIREMCAEAKVIYVGDSYQLPPINESISSILSAGIQEVKLTTPQRFALHSPIYHLAYQLRDTIDTGIFPTLENIDTAIQISDLDHFKNKIDNTFHKHMPKNSSKIVAWTNDRVNDYNTYIKKKYSTTPHPEIGETLINNNLIIYTDFSISADTPVLVHNVTESTSFDIDTWHIELGAGHFIHVAKNPKHVRDLTAHFAKHKNWNKFFEIKEHFADLRPRYASTIHKAQGSTYENIYIDLDDIGKVRDKILLARLLYVAVTRAQKNVIIRGQIPTHYT